MATQVAASRPSSLGIRTGREAGKRKGGGATTAKSRTAPEGEILGANLGRVSWQAPSGAEMEVQAHPFWSAKHNPNGRTRTPRRGETALEPLGGTNIAPGRRGAGKRRGSALGWAKREPTASRPPAWGERPRWGLGGRFSHKPPTRAGARLGSFSLSFSWGEKRDEPTDDQTARNRTRKPGATPPNRTAANPPRTGTVAQATFRCLMAV